MNEHKSLLIHLSEWWETRQLLTKPHVKWQHWLPTPGNTIFTLLVLGLLIATQNVWAKPLQSALNAPGPSATTINYQGRLADSGGNPVSDGSYGMSFALYDADTDGSALWTESHAAVPVSEGLFSIGLGSQTTGGIPTTMWNGDRYLEITVSGEILSPRELIRSVPVAGMALTVPDGTITQEQADFAPSVYHEWAGNLESVDKPIIYSGWFHGSAGGNATYDLSHISSQIDAVMVTRTRTSGGVNNQVIFMVTDVAGTGRPVPSEIKVWAYKPDGTLDSWIEAYVVIVGR